MVSTSNMLPVRAILPSAKTIVSTAASIAASAMVIRSVARDLMPYELQMYISTSIRSLFKSFSPEVTLIIKKSAGLTTNQIYNAAQIYLGIKFSPHEKKFMVTMPKQETTISTSMAKKHLVVDQYNGASLKWKHITGWEESSRSNSSIFSEKTVKKEYSYFELCFHKKHKEMVFDQYFPYILSESKAMIEERKTPKIYSLNTDHLRRSPGEYSSNSIRLNHPATFATLAMDTEIKKTIMDDLEKFVRRRDFYRKVGKAWTRGYLLYGPPGTGKSSLIAAMANHLNFDVYDLELTGISNNSDLRKLLINTSNRSILVVEDIDSSFDDLKDEERALKMLKSSKDQIQTVNIVRKDKRQVTLSGLLNIIDGLWSSCGDERIIVFTTNHKDRLDPALLRPGRMDMHIYMSYCIPCAFKTLAANYHGVSDHSLFNEINGLLEVAMITPAQVCEQLLRSDNVDVALTGLIEFLQQIIRKSEEQKQRSENHKKRKMGSES